MRVVIADDSLITRQGIASLVSRAGFEVVGQAGDAEALVDQVDRMRPDVAIVDIRMPPTHTDEGLVAAQRIRRAHRAVGVLVLSQYIESSYAARLLADYPERSGYLLKDRILDAAVLIDGLRRIHAGETVIDYAIVATLLNRARAQDPLSVLSARERDVLSLMAEGLSNQAIASRLSITPRTVEAHATRLFLKLGIDGDPGSHRRVRAVVAFLRSSPGEPARTGRSR